MGDWARVYTKPAQSMTAPGNGMRPLFSGHTFEFLSLSAGVTGVCAFSQSTAGIIDAQDGNVKWADLVRWHPGAGLPPLSHYQLFQRLV